MELWNIRTATKIYDFTAPASSLNKHLIQIINDDLEILNDTGASFSQKIHETANIVCIENSPALDVVSMALTDGSILLLNLKQDKIIQQFKISNSKPLCIAFSQVDKPLLASGDDQGNIDIWDLNEGKMFSKIKSAHKEYVNYLEFAKDELQLISGSAGDNALKLWQYDESDDSKFSCLRERSGLANPLKKVSFYGDEGHHVIASSSGEEAELKDFFLWNEAFNGKFSLVNILSSTFLIIDYIETKQEINKKNVKYRKSSKYFPNF